jgi:hypothetical protein
VDAPWTALLTSPSAASAVPGTEWGPVLLVLLVALVLLGLGLVLRRRAVRRRR